MWSLGSRPAPAGKCRRAGEQSGAAPGSARSELLAASGRPAARQARCEPEAAAAAAGWEPALGEGAAAVPAPPARGGACGPIVSRPRGVRRWGARGGQRRRLRSLSTPVAAGATSAAVAARGRVSHTKGSRASPGARTGPRRRRALPTLPAFLSLQF